MLLERPARDDVTWDVHVFRGTPAMEDRGCEYHPSCLTCPFEVCRFEAHSGLLTLRVRQDAQRARALRAAGVAVGDVARVLDVSVRTVYRLLAA